MPLLPLDRPARPLADPVGGGDQQAIDEAGAGRLAQERVNVGLLDRVGGVVCLRLDRPKPAVLFLGDQVDPRIRPPVLRPLGPEPDVLEAAPVLGGVGQIPVAESLELVSAPSSDRDRVDRAARRGSWGGPSVSGEPGPTVCPGVSPGLPWPTPGAVSFSHRQPSLVPDYTIRGCPPSRGPPA